ncbi:MAG: hypothetical protein SH850_19050 [Planctomycetaceae bacterium]|nr:hypothetical protein [Planctomycetaceae bacterium]
MLREPPRSPQPLSRRRGDALKTVLIVMAILGGLMVLSCLGVGVAGYFWFQKNLANAAVTDPVKIRQMTADQTDITIPAEFVPQTGSQLFGMNIVNYQWCPTGTCAAMGGDDEAEFNAGTLTLTTFATDGPVDVDADVFWEESFAETNLNERFRNYSKDVKELTIRGKACKFFIVKGEEIPWDVVAEVDDPEMADATSETPAEPITDPAATPATTDPVVTPVAPAPVAAPSAPAKLGRQIVWVQGVFPGKKGDCTLNVYLLGGDYDEAKILAMLQSIK